MTTGMAALGGEILVGSGAVGTVLRRGQEQAGEPVELLNLRRPRTRDTSAWSLR